VAGGTPQPIAAGATGPPTTGLTTRSHDDPAVEPPPIPFEPWRVPQPAIAQPVDLSSPSSPSAPRPADPWNVEAEAAKVAQVLPFTPKPDEQPDEQTRAIHTAAAAIGVRSATPTPVARPAPVPIAERSTGLFAVNEGVNENERGRKRGWRIDWRRTAAASLAVILLEGVAFATAYWFVRPAETGTLLVQSSLAGVEVLVDGRHSGRTPLTMELKPGRYTLEMRAAGATKVVPVEISPGVQTTQSVKWPQISRVGKLKVTTSPTGAEILVDGKPRGTSPLTIDDLPVGSHTVVARGESGTVRTQVTITEEDVAEVDLGIFSGWLTVFAPVEVRVFDAGKLLGTSIDGKMLISAGTHQLELVNKALGYRDSRTVEIEPGRNTVLSVQVPDGSIVIEAPDGTEVTVDGQPAGVLPLPSVKAPIGTREVVLKHPSIGQRRVMVTVGASVPARVSMLAPQ
jgi:hypothetical protein